MKVDPALEPVPDDPSHRVACLLDTQTRQRLWRELREGTAPDEARQDVMKDAPPPEAIAAAEEIGEGKPLGTAEVRPRGRPRGAEPMSDSRHHRRERSDPPSRPASR